MTTKRRRQSRLPPFVPLIKTTMATPAWRAMSPGARLLYIEMRACLRNDYANNGKVFRSCRAAAKAIGATTQSIVRWFAENEHYGFLRKTGEGFLGLNGRGIAARYRLTEFSREGEAATCDFEKWSGELFAYAPRRPGRKKQNPVMMVSTPRDDGQHIRKRPGRTSVCADGQHIESPARCDDGQHVSRIASGGGPPGTDQGSSTARAPAQAGDVGSSPAPDAKPGLANETAEKKPWSTPTVEEVPWDTLPTELRMLVLGSDPADVISTPDPPVPPSRPMLPGDRRRAEILARNQEALRRFDAICDRRASS